MPEPREWPLHERACDTCGYWHAPTPIIPFHYAHPGPPHQCRWAGYEIGPWDSSLFPAYIGGLTACPGGCPGIEPNLICTFEPDEEEDEEYGSSSLLSYDWAPSRFHFHGEGPAFFGMEIEVTASEYETENAVHKGMNYPDLLYFKEDGSVDGFEMVTHPMSYDWALENFPWHLLPEFKSNGCRIQTAENGIHIHVNRTAFTDGAHLYRWMKFIYRNQHDVERVARRQSGGWAAFSDQHRCHQLDHIKAQKAPVGRYVEDATARLRYSAINTSNEDTLEVRVFASTLVPKRAKAALGLMSASVEYTRRLTVPEIMRGGWEWGDRGFRAWLKADPERCRKYADLLDLDALLPHPCDD